MLAFGQLFVHSIRFNLILRSLVPGHIDEVIPTAIDRCCSCTLSSGGSSLDMNGMNPLPGLGVNIHIRLLDGSLPVVVLGGKFEEISAGVRM